VSAAQPITAIVYQARNVVNGHRYIGFTTRTLAKRETQHRSDARQGRGHVFHKALRKYGEGSFIFEVLADFDDMDLAKLYEFEAIAKHRPEYNLRAGGDGGGALAESTRRKISAAQKGVPAPQRSHPVSDETKRKISAGNKGHPVSPETIAKIKATRLARGPTDKEKAAWAREPTWLREARRVPVRCLTDGREFPSCRAADKFYGLHLGATSAKAISGRATVTGLRFEFVSKKNVK
jgi:group I intron endonuclease